MSGSSRRRSRSARTLPLEVLTDTIQPFPTFSEVFVATLKKLRLNIAAMSKAAPTGPPMTG